MKIRMKQALEAVAVSAIALSLIGTSGAMARKKTDTVKSAPPAAEFCPRGKTAAGNCIQILDKGKITVKPDAETPVDAPATDIETGQMLDKGPRWKPSVTAQGQTGGDTPVDAPATDFETGQIRIKPPAAAAENDLCGLPYTMPCRTDAPAAEVEQKQIRIKPNAKVSKADGDDGNQRVLFALLGAAAVAGIVLAAGGNDGPTSP